LVRQLPTVVIGRHLQVGILVTDGLNEQALGRIAGDEGRTG